MKLTSASLKEQFDIAAHAVHRYALLLFALFFLAVYSYLGWRIVALSQVEPSQTAVDAQLQSAGVPHIDQQAISKLQQLQDNSVEVRTLFNNARSNPFQE